MTLFHNIENTGELGSTTPPMAALRDWTADLNNALASGSEVPLPPDLPLFQKRRERREYLRGLRDSGHILGSAYEVAVASSGLVEALHIVREQQLQLSPPKRTPYTPRHQR